MEAILDFIIANLNIITAAMGAILLYLLPSPMPNFWRKVLVILEKILEKILVQKK